MTYTISLSGGGIVVTVKYSPRFKSKPIIFLEDHHSKISGIAVFVCKRCKSSASNLVKLLC